MQTRSLLVPLALLGAFGAIYYLVVITGLHFSNKIVSLAFVLAWLSLPLIGMFTLPESWRKTWITKTVISLYSIFVAFAAIVAGVHEADKHEKVILTQGEYSILYQHWLFHGRDRVDVFARTSVLPGIDRSSWMWCDIGATDAQAQLADPTTLEITFLPLGNTKKLDWPPHSY